MPTIEDGNQNTNIVGKSKRNSYLHSMSTTAPIYPKEDPNYRREIMERFIQQVKNTRWETSEAVSRTPKRKGKQSTRVEAVPRSEREARAVGQSYTPPRY